MGTMLRVKKILVPTDFSSHSAFALDIAQQIAKRFHAKLSLLHVLIEPAFGIYVPQTISEGELREAGFQEAKRQMARFLKKSGSKISPRSVVYRWGLSSVQILKFAKEEKMDLIVMGSLGCTNILDYLIGSTAEHVVRHSKVPVLVVRG
ncbi:MAG: universal stress protein [Deltaproteobacteria bacterium]|nr:universal stress protein [Deltaproteobacteria bacterium]